MKSNRVWLILAVILGVLLIVIVLLPPRNPQQVGSTFGKTPDGYGAWYAYMKEQNYKIEQLQKSEKEFLSKPPSKPATLLRIYPDFYYGYVSEDLEKWIKQGNQLVLVGIRTPATEAPFKSSFNTPQGEVTIETRRRLPKDKIASGKINKDQALLEDESGLVVWEATLEKGKIIFVVTPYLAANAYQDSQGNFAYLAHLVNAKTNTIVVDEYIHGYIDKEELIQDAKTRSWFTYLTNTPLVILFLQLGIVMLLLLWSQNRRFGNTLPIKSPVRNNNLDYIDALSEVLFKTENYSFLINKIAKAEQIYIQQKLGLGSTSLPLHVVSEAWQQQAKGSKAEIMAVLQTNHPRRSIKEVFDWLKRLAELRSKLG